MTEFLHQVVKKREREQEMRTLQDTIFRMPTGRGFSVPLLRMPPMNEIAYRSNTLGAQTEHFVVFPNVGNWIQSAVSITTLSTTTVISHQMLVLNAWELIAGHACRPNYRWANNTYTCMFCSGTYETDGSEWRRG
jgi:hypothetical protein